MLDYITAGWISIGFAQQSSHAAVWRCRCTLPRRDRALVDPLSSPLTPSRVSNQSVRADRQMSAFVS